VRLSPSVLASVLVSLSLSPPAEGRTLYGTVVSVVDGDTIRVQVGNAVETVRYIGINTPEVHHPTRGEQPGGREALQLNHGLVGGRRVRLELDVQERDEYQRLLAYVWVDDTMVNAELIRRGYAYVASLPPNVRYQGLFWTLLREAREARRGMWQRTSGRATPSRDLAGAPALRTGAALIARSG
jgi:micrococcal nuclease